MFENNMLSISVNFICTDRRVHIAPIGVQPDKNLVLTNNYKIKLPVCSPVVKLYRLDSNLYHSIILERSYSYLLAKMGLKRTISLEYEDGWPTVFIRLNELQSL